MLISIAFPTVELTLRIYVIIYYTVCSKWKGVFDIVDFGEKIKHLRLGAGLTQVQVSKRLHISKAMISSYETGIRLPSYDVLIKFARLFGVTTDYLLGFDRIKSVDVSGISDLQVDLIVKLINELKSAT